MNTWNLTVNNNAKAIVKQLQAAFGSVDDFVFNIHQQKTDSASFNLRKRIQYPDQVLHRNRIVVNGDLITSDSNETNVTVSFHHHIIMKLTLLTALISGGVALFILVKSSLPLYLGIGIILLLGVVMWLALQKKFEKDVDAYKELLSKVLVPE